MGHKEIQVANTLIRSSTPLGGITENSARTLVGINPNGTRFSRQFANEAIMKQWMTQADSNGVEIISVS